MVPNPDSRTFVDQSPRTILVVEDEVLIRIDISEALRSEGFEVLEASNADEAISILACGVAVAMVFTDIRMPGKADGLDLARYVRTNHRTTKVMITSGHFPAHQLEAEFGQLISKPYTHERIIEEIEKRLTNGQGG